MFKADEMSFRTIGKKFGNQKEVDKFRYHAESAFFHLGAQNAHGRQWHSEGLELCFGNCVTYFLQCLKTENWKHYFVPGVNLFSQDQIEK